MHFGHVVCMLVAFTVVYNAMMMIFSSRNASYFVCVCVCARARVSAQQISNYPITTFMPIEFLLLLLLLLFYFLFFFPFSSSSSLSWTALGGLWLSSQLAPIYFVHVPSLSIYQSSFVLGCPSPLGTTSF
jgi:hypothetical protein